MKRSIERARQKAALEAVENYEDRISKLEAQVKKLTNAMNKLMKGKPAASSVKGGSDG